MTLVANSMSKVIINICAAASINKISIRPLGPIFLASILLHGVHLTALGHRAGKTWTIAVPCPSSSTYTPDAGSLFQIGCHEAKISS